MNTVVDSISQIPPDQPVYICNIDLEAAYMVCADRHLLGFSSQKPREPCQFYQFACLPFGPFGLRLATSILHIMCVRINEHTILKDWFHLGQWNDLMKN